MRWMLIAIAIAGCGGSSKKKPECLDCGLGPGGMNPHGFQEGRARKILCDLAQRHASAGCSPFDRMDPSLLSSCSVVTSFQMAGMDQCLGENSCETLAVCFEKARALENPPPYTGPTRECTVPKDHEDLAYPAGIPREQMHESYGALDRTYADSPSSKEKPIEVCGFPAAGAYLARLTCKDGSRPLPSRIDAERARVGNVGEGGRCGRIIDEYRVECPEKSYGIFIDAYRCQR